MSLAQSLNDFQARSAQCDSLIINAHKVDVSGHPLFPLSDTKQITIAAFLNLYIAWETFLEDSLTKLMSGSPTISGAVPIRYVHPLTQDHAKNMVIGINRYFDYANLQYFTRIVKMYFDGGYPFEPHLSSIHTDLTDMRTMRNASAHITTTTQTALEGLAQRLLGTPQPGIDLYSLLTAIHPHATDETIYSESKNKLLAAAHLIATG